MKVRAKQDQLDAFKYLDGSEYYPDWFQSAVEHERILFVDNGELHVLTDGGGCVAAKKGDYVMKYFGGGLGVVSEKDFWDNYEVVK